MHEFPPMYLQDGIHEVQSLLLAAFVFPEHTFFAQG